MEENDLNLTKFETDDVDNTTRNVVSEIKESIENKDRNDICSKHTVYPSQKIDNDKNLSVENKENHRIMDVESDLDEQANFFRQEENDLNLTKIETDDVGNTIRNVVSEIMESIANNDRNDSCSKHTVYPSQKIDNDKNVSVENKENPRIMDVKSDLDEQDNSLKNMHIDWKTAIEDLDQEKLAEGLKGLPKEELLNIAKEIEKNNSLISKENNMYNFLLEEDESIKNALYNTDFEISQYSSRESLSDSEKGFLAMKKLNYLQTNLDIRKEGYIKKMQTLKFQLESVDKSLKDLEDQREKFIKNVKIGGRHPVTKIIMLQKVVLHIENEIKAKTALANRYKMQIHGDITEHSKVLSQISAQKKRIATLDITQYQEAKFEYTKYSRELNLCKDQLAKYKTKFSPLLQSISEMKKALEKEQKEMDRMKNAVARLEHLKRVMMNEKSRNDKNVSELRAAMRKIKLDPRRHNLPEVIDYAAAKKENSALKQDIKKWKRKVETIQQEKFLYLSSFSKRA